MKDADLDLPTPWATPDLADTVAVVTGASRGVGRGIALALADAGATVVVTGRSRVGADTTEGLTGDIDTTAAEVTARSGRGIAVACDHQDDDQTRAAFATIEAEVGRIDLLINNVWAGYERWGERRFDAKFWEQPLWRYDLCFDSVRAHYLCSQLAAPMLLDAPRGVVITVGYTDGPTYLGQVAYDVAKHAADRMVVAMAHDLARTDVIALGLHPGFVRTERVSGAADHLIGGPATIVHSPEYVGRAVAHLAADPDLASRAGTIVAVGDLADVYGFDDIDGRRPAAFRLEGKRTLASRMEKLHHAAASGPRGDES